MNFPYDGKSVFTPSADPVVAELQRAHSRVEDMLLSLGRPDPDVKLLAHLDGDALGHLGQVGTVTGPVRYPGGRFPESQGLLVEGPGWNLVPNPSAEVNTTGFTVLDPSLALTRSTSACQADAVVSQASFQLSGTGDAGAARLTSGSLAVNPGESYSASVYVYSERLLKVKLELSFTGGAAVAYDTGDVTLQPGAWTRLQLLDRAAQDNTAVELRLYLVQQAPSFAEGSLFCKRIQASVAPVTDTTLPLVAGDVVTAALTANPAGPRYAFHMVTTGATGVASPDLRLDDASAGPEFVAGSLLSRWAGVAGSAPVTDGALVLGAGDLAFCQLEGEGYGWHLVTAGATGVSSLALRLDGAPAAPRFVEGSRLSRFQPTASVPVEDAGLALAPGDLVFCFPTAAPATGGYGWHVVTNGATGASSSELRLDGAEVRPTFAAGSRLSKVVPEAAAPVFDTTLTIEAGSLAWCHPTANPAAGGYGWHMVTAGSTGVSSTDLRLDQATSEVLYADAFQLEEGGLASGYIDSYQGTGFSGSLGAATERAPGGLSYPVPGIVAASGGTVAFWARPSWPGNDGGEHVLFDLAVAASRDRLRFAKDRDDRLTVSVYDSDSELKQLVSSDPVSFLAGTWHHFAFTWDDGTLALFLDGLELPTVPVGSGSGRLGSLPGAFHVGTDHEGRVSGGMVLDDLLVKGSAATAEEIACLARANVANLGMSPSLSGFTTAAGAGATHATPGTEISVAHGLGVVPAGLLLTPTANGVVYLSREPDATHFYVKGSAADLTFYWRAFA